MASVVFAPSILAADFGKLEEEIKSVDSVADSIHVDVMDGHFVPNITIGPVVANSLKGSEEITTPFNIHLMIDDPWRYGPEFAVGSRDLIIFHAEATNKPRELIERLRQNGSKVGISQKPASPVENIFPLLSELDEVLVMGVEPGFGGQEFMPEALKRIENLRGRIREGNYDTTISVDGGMNPSTVGEVAEAGADKIIAGSAVFGRQNRQEAIHEMKEALK